MMSYKGLRKHYCEICGKTATRCGRPGWNCTEHVDTTEEPRYDADTGQPLSS